MILNLGRFCLLREIRQCFGAILFVTTRGAAGILWEEARTLLNTLHAQAAPMTRNNQSLCWGRECWAPPAHLSLFYFLHFWNLKKVTTVLKIKVESGKPRDSSTCSSSRLQRVPLLKAQEVAIQPQLCFHTLSPAFLRGICPWLWPFCPPPFKLIYWPPLMSNQNTLWRGVQAWRGLLIYSKTHLQHLSAIYHVSHTGTS